MLLMSMERGLLRKKDGKDLDNLIEDFYGGDDSDDSDKGEPMEHDNANLDEPLISNDSERYFYFKMQKLFK